MAVLFRSFITVHAALTVKVNLGALVVAVVCGKGSFDRPPNAQRSRNLTITGGIHVAVLLVAPAPESAAP